MNLFLAQGYCSVVYRKKHHSLFIYFLLSYHLLLRILHPCFIPIFVPIRTELSTNHPGRKPQRRKLSHHLFTNDVTLIFANFLMALSQIYTCKQDYVMLTLHCTKYSRQKLMARSMLDHCMAWFHSYTHTHTRLETTPPPLLPLPSCLYILSSYTFLPLPDSRQMVVIMVVSLFSRSIPIIGCFIRHLVILFFPFLFLISSSRSYFSFSFCRSRFTLSIFFQISSSYEHLFFLFCYKFIISFSFIALKQEEIILFSI